MLHVYVYCFVLFLIPHKNSCCKSAMPRVAPKAPASPPVLFEVGVSFDDDAVDECVGDVPASTPLAICRFFSCSSNMRSSIESFYCCFKKCGSSKKAAFDDELTLSGENPVIILITLIMNRITVTSFVCPSLCTRSIACCSTDGFHHGSNIYTRDACYICIEKEGNT